MAWMFTQEFEKKVKLDSQELIAFHKESQQLIVFLETCLALKTPAMRSDPVMMGLQGLHKNLQDRSSFYIYIL